MEYCLACGVSKATFERAKKVLKDKSLINVSLQGKGKDRISIISRVEPPTSF